VDLSIIIVNWKSADFVRSCLRSVHRHTTGIGFEIIVIDNASFDGCGEMLSKEFPATVFVQGDTNLGFARANNRAVVRSRGDVLLFLNPDTELRGPALNALLDAVRVHSDSGAAGPRLVNTDGSLQRSCVQSFPTIANQVWDADLLRNWFPRAPLWGTAALYGSSADPQVVEGISGACLMTPRSVFEKVGGFTEDYFMYYEDMDFCLKTSRAGLRNYYVPGAEVVHHAGSSSGGGYSEFSAIMMSESAWRFFRLRTSPAYARLFRACLAMKAIARAVVIAFLYPFLFAAGRRKTAANASRKWTSVLMWSLGRRRKWVRQYV
jgi:N-acetylglucosaminyl-diphospho-decaprenol L-rhamnosyltransferase